MREYLLAQISRTKMYGHLMEVFKAIDKENTGTISRGDLMKAFRTHAEHINLKEVDKIIEEINEKTAPEINYGDYIIFACD